jgi:hypothetical protein
MEGSHHWTRDLRRMPRDGTEVRKTLCLFVQGTIYSLV